MTNEEKDLLLKDLCARLPYGVKIRVAYPFLEEKDMHPEDLYGLELRKQVVAETSIRIEEIKPYLRPMLSMTAEEEKEFLSLKCGLDVPDLSDVMNLVFNTDSIDWLNEHHFDYHGLIGKGLALEAPEGMYNIKSDFKLI